MSFLVVYLLQLILNIPLEQTFRQLLISSPLLSMLSMFLMYMSILTLRNNPVNLQFDGSRDNLLEVVDGDGVIQSFRVFDQSPAESRLQFVQFSVDISLRVRRQVPARADVAVAFSRPPPRRVGRRRVVGRPHGSPRQRDDRRHPRRKQPTSHRQTSLSTSDRISLRDQP